MITRIDPPDWAASSTVQLESDAADNMAAIREIDEWAAKEGFARTTEYWLRQVMVEGQRRFRGVCYRVAEDEIAAAKASSAVAEERMRAMPIERRRGA